MQQKTIVVILVAAALVSCWLWTGFSTSFSRDRVVLPYSPVLAYAGTYVITAKEFQAEFAASPYAARPDPLQARREFLESLINQKLILLDAQKNNLDKDPEFLRSIEHFWAQSLLNVAVGQKTAELHKSIHVREEDVRRIYDGMVKDGVTAKPFADVYPQIKYQAEKQAEAQRLNAWINTLRKGSSVSVNEGVLKALK